MLPSLIQIISLSSFVDQNLLIDEDWAAYAYVNSWLSVYRGDYYKDVAVQMHGKYKRPSNSRIITFVIPLTKDKSDIVASNRFRNWPQF